jgi:hypothetical protein
MNSRFLLSTLLVATLGLTILSLVPVRSRAQTGDRKNDAKATAGSSFEGEIMDNECAEMGSHDITMKATSLATPDLCTTYCLHFKKTPGKYVLYNGATKMIYQLDNQQEASFFAARKVKVTGTYDKAMRTIHITDITSTPTS